MAVSIERLEQLAHQSVGDVAALCRAQALVDAQYGKEIELCRNIWSDSDITLCDYDGIAFKVVDEYMYDRLHEGGNDARDRLLLDGEYSTFASLVARWYISHLGDRGAEIADYDVPRAVCLYAALSNEIDLCLAVDGPVAEAIDTATTDDERRKMEQASDQLKGYFNNKTDHVSFLDKCGAANKNVSAVGRAYADCCGRDFRDKEDRDKLVSILKTLHLIPQKASDDNTRHAFGGQK